MSTCFRVFAECYTAIKSGVMIVRESASDKEFHFQNWMQERLKQTGLKFERRGRNAFPDFVLVERAEGYEVKGLGYPGRELNYDSNSQVPCGRHSGREVYYVFGRYPTDGEKEYEVIDLILCHGSFLNADNEYLHKNDHVKAFGSLSGTHIRHARRLATAGGSGLPRGRDGGFVRYRLQPLATSSRSRNGRHPVHASTLAVARRASHHMSPGPR
jgi:hypothetical protein